MITTTLMRLAVVIIALAAASSVRSAHPAAVEPLHLENVIPMEDVQGRIDHLSVDVRGQRLFVAALGNNTLEVIDLGAGKRLHAIHGLAAPQGILYVPATGRIFVANDKDGSVRIFDGTSFGLLKTISYGDDADNLRYDNATGHVYVAYGSGVLGEMDQDGTKVADIRLDAHPESFQLEKSGPRIFVNQPDSLKIAVIDRRSKTVTTTWRTGGPLANFPMALDENHHRLFVVCRLPARLVIFDTDHGNRITSIPAIGDCDDVFYDERRHRIYAIGGEGGIAVFQQQDPDHYSEIARIATVSGARTGLFSPDLDKLYVAVRRHGSLPAGIRVYSLAP